MKTAENEIRNLVFAGGGTKDSAFAGCVEVMDQLGLYQDIENVAGTSSGAITATLLACGAASKGLSEAVYHTNFDQFISDCGGAIADAYRTIKHYGMHTGDGFVTILRQDIKRYAGNEALTFAQLGKLVQEDPKNFRRLSAVASNLTRQRPQIFDAELTPELPIWQAVRASISLPFIFEPTIIDGDFFVDGGLSWDYPLDIFDKIEVDRVTGNRTIERNPHTLGFYFASKAQLHSTKPFEPSKVQIDSLKSFAVSMASFLIETNNDKNMHPEDALRTVFVDDFGISSINFKLSKEKVDALVESGRQAALAFFEKRNS